MSGLVLVILLGIGFIVYFLPYIAACNRNAPDLGLLFCVNFFLGWTLFGWLFAMWMALRPPRGDAVGPPPPARTYDRSSRPSR